MSTLNVNTVEPAGATLTIGASGDTVKANDSVNVNTVKDAGGNTIWVSNGSGVLSSVNSAFGDALVLLSTQTASADSEVEFTSDIDSTYKEYIFKFVNIDTATNEAYFQFQTSIDGGSSWGVTTTTTSFYGQTQTNGSYNYGYQTDQDLAASTSYQDIIQYMSTTSTHSGSGYLHIFNPSSTTYQKNFFSRSANYNANGPPAAPSVYTAGYFNTTSAIDAVRFQMNTGNIASGTIKMYGVS